MSGTIIKAITIHQPYAALIMQGLKRIETRGWATRYRGPLAIHAARTTASMSQELMEDVEKAGFVKTGYWALFEREVLMSQLGTVVGLVDLVDVRPTEQIGNVQAELRWGDFSAGRYGWFLDNPRPLHLPTRVQGQLGLWDWRAPW